MPSKYPGPKAGGYTLQVSLNSTFTQLVYTGKPKTISFIPTAYLPRSQDSLYWRVRTNGINGPALGQTPAVSVPAIHQASRY